jgi:hypothetical protein
MVTTKIMLSDVVHGEPSGNYDGSSLDWASDAVQAANYYNGRSGVQTVLLVLDQFVGEIRIDATLDSVASQATWFETGAYDSQLAPTTGTVALSILGNFTWLRARVLAFESGTIESITVSY